MSASLSIPVFSDLDLAFSTGEHTPEFNKIPDKFKKDNNIFCKLFNLIFFNGVDLKKLTPKNGIDLTKNLRFFRHCATTFSTKHEHKEAACAWILSETFEEPDLKLLEKGNND